MHPQIVARWILFLYENLRGAICSAFSLFPSFSSPWCNTMPNVPSLVQKRPARHVLRSFTGFCPFAVEQLNAMLERTDALSSNIDFSAQLC